MIRFACDQCGGEANASEERAGSEYECPGCRKVLVVPGHDVPATARAEGTSGSPAPEERGDELKAFLAGYPDYRAEEPAKHSASEDAESPETPSPSRETWLEAVLPRQGDSGEGIPDGHGGADSGACALPVTEGQTQVGDEAEEVPAFVRIVSLALALAVMPYRATVRKGHSSWANAALVALTSVVSLVALVFLMGDSASVLRFALWSEGNFSPHQLVSHMFLHAGLEHLVGNMAFLWVFGAAIAAPLSGAGYLVAYLSLGILAGLFGHVLPAQVDGDVPAVGASGAICALTGVYLVLFARHHVHMAAWFRPFFWRRPRVKTFRLRGIYVVLSYAAFDVAAVTLGWTGNVAHWVHLAGFGWGLTVGLGVLLSGVIETEGDDLLTWIAGHRWRRGVARMAIALMWLLVGGTVVWVGLSARRRYIAHEYLALGKAYEKRGNLERAIAGYTKAIKTDTDCVKAYRRRAEAYKERGDLDHAIEDYSKIIELKPDDADSYCERADFYFYRSDYEKAIADYTKAIKTDAACVKAYRRRAEAYDGRGELDHAIEDYTKIIELKPDDAYSYCARADFYYLGSDYEKAIPDYTKMIGLEADSMWGYYYRACCYGREGKYERAIEDFSTVISFMPGSANAYYNRGRAYDKQGRLGDAIVDYTKAIELKPDCVKAYNHRGRAYLREGDHDCARQDFEKAVELDPDGQAGRTAMKALRGLSTRLPLESMVAPGYLKRGIAYGKKGKLDRAIADLTKAIEIRPDYAEAYNSRGVAHSHKGDLTRAVEDYTTAIKFKPDFPKAYFNRGIAHRKKGDLDRARRDFENAVELDPDGKVGRMARTTLRTLPAPLPRETAPATPDDLPSKACEKYGRSLRERSTADPDITIAVRRDGSAWVDGERYGHEALKRFLASKAAESPKDEEGLSTLSVRIVAHKDTEYKIVERVMVACMKGHIWKLSFGALPDEKPGPEEER